MSRRASFWSGNGNARTVYHLEGTRSCDMDRLTSGLSVSRYFCDNVVELLNKLLGMRWASCDGLVLEFYTILNGTRRSNPKRKNRKVKICSHMDAENDFFCLWFRYRKEEEKPR